MAGRGYPLDKRAWVRWAHSFSKYWGADIQTTWVTRVLRMAHFWAGWWWEFAWRYRSVCVFFLKTWWVNDPPGSRITSTSRKGKEFSNWVSMVNLTQVERLSRCSRNEPRATWPWGQMTKVPSTNLNEHLGFWWKLFRAKVSKCSINMLATTRERDEPVAVPSVFS